MREQLGVVGFRGSQAGCAGPKIFLLPEGGSCYGAADLQLRRVRKAKSMKKSRLTLPGMLGASVSLWFAFAAVFDPAYAESDLPPPDVIACLKAVQPLDMRYRSWMEQRCASVAFEICAKVDAETGSCLSDVIASMHLFHDRLMSVLPAKIDGYGLLPGRYERTLERTRDTFDTVSGCDGQNGYAQTRCEFVALSIATLESFYLAELADVDIP